MNRARRESTARSLPHALAAALALSACAALWCASVSCQATYGRRQVVSPSGTFLVTSYDPRDAEQVAARAEETLAEIERYLPPVSSESLRIQVSGAEEDAEGARFVTLPFHGGVIRLPRHCDPRESTWALVHAALHRARVESWPWALREGLAVLVRDRIAPPGWTDRTLNDYALAAAGYSGKWARVSYRSGVTTRWLRVQLGSGACEREFRSLDEVLELSRSEYEELGPADRFAVLGAIGVLLERIEANGDLAAFTSELCASGRKPDARTLLASAGYAAEDAYWTALPELARARAGEVLMHSPRTRELLEEGEQDLAKLGTRELFLSTVQPRIEFEGETRGFGELAEFGFWAESIWGADDEAVAVPASFERER